MRKNKTNIVLKDNLITVSTRAHLNTRDENPEPVDWRKKTVLSPVLDQGNCGDCWAFASTSTLADRFIIGANYKNGLSLDPYILSSCASYEGGCKGGDIPGAIYYLAKNGTYEMDNKKPDCGENISFLINSSGSISLPSCLKDKCKNTPVFKAVLPECRDGNEDVKEDQCGLEIIQVTGGDNSNTIDENMTILEMKNRLKKGPIISSMRVTWDFQILPFANGKFLKEVAKRKNQLINMEDFIYVKSLYNDYCNDIKNMIKTSDFPSDFYDENGGVNTPVFPGDSVKDYGTLTGEGHAISIVGWGKGRVKETDLEYWIIRNSWGESWGDNGFLKVAISTFKVGNYSNQGMGFDVISAQETETTITNGVSSTETKTVNIGGSFEIQADLSSVDLNFTPKTIQKNTDTNSSTNSSTNTDTNSSTNTDNSISTDITKKALNNLEDIYKKPKNHLILILLGILIIVILISVLIFLFFIKK